MIQVTDERLCGCCLAPLDGKASRAVFCSRRCKDRQYRRDRQPPLTSAEFTEIMRRVHEGPDPQAVWREIPGTGGFYEVTPGTDRYPASRVRSIIPELDRWWAGTSSATGPTENNLRKER